METDLRKSPKICMRRKRDLSENVEWQTVQGMYVHIWAAEYFQAGRYGHSSRFAFRGWRLVPFMGERSHTTFRFRLKGLAKRKIYKKSVKAPLWHKPKRNGPCFISLNLLFRHEAKPFSTFMSIIGTHLGNGVPTVCNHFYGKALYQDKKTKRSYPQSPVLFIILYLKSSLKVVQHAEAYCSR